jgi:hypothetical protein
MYANPEPLRFMPIRDGSRSRSVLLDISERARDIFVLTDGHRYLPIVRTQTLSPPHLPDPRISAQHFIDMGLRPSTAERLLISFMKLVAQYRQGLESYFGRAVQGGCHLPPAFYRDTFVILYERTIQSWESQIVSTVQVWLCQTGVFSSGRHLRYMDVSLVGHLLALLDVHLHLLSVTCGRYCEECHSF